jgi:protoheme IX farnesyltransferase
MNASGLVGSLVLNKKRASLGQYWKLSKGHLTVWVAISSFPGYLVSVSWPFSPLVAGSVFIGTALTSACAQSLNQMKEVDRDALMKRTKNRPLVTGVMSMQEARHFALISGLSGSAILALGTGSILASALAVSTAGLYASVYTPMKVRSEYNTHIGAVVGSLPVLIGFAAAGVPLWGSFSPWVLFSLQTLWQFPHFYALAWLHKEDYQAGGYRMFPMTDESGRATAKMCIPYLGGLSVLPLVSSGLVVTSCMFAVSGSVPNIIWIKYGFIPFYRDPSKAKARAFFLHSLWYLVAMYAAFVVHAMPAGELDLRLKIKAKLLEICPHMHAVKDWTIPAVLCPTEWTKDKEQPDSNLNPS